MSITVEMMQAAAASGLSKICATCDRYWEARAKGIPGDQCTAPLPCGSPLVHDTFSYYRGPLTDEAFAHFCFVCGAPEKAAVRVPGRKRLIGVCSDHYDWVLNSLNPLRPSDKVREIPLPSKDTLAGAILNTEQEWAEQDGRKFDPAEFLSPKAPR